MNVVMSSVSGSPGVSVWLMLLNGLWPSDNALERVGVEADTAGGVMGVRYRLDSKTDLLVAESSRWEGSSAAVEVSRFATKVGEGAWLVPGPKTPESAAKVWRAAGGASSVASLAARDRRVWMFDVGRARPDGELSPLFDDAAVSVLFVRGSAEELTKVRGRIAALKRTGAQVLVAVTGESDHGHGEVTEFLGIPNVHFLPDDGNLVSDTQQVWASRRSRRRNVWEAGSALAGAIAEVLEYSPRGVMRVEAEAS